LQEIFDTDFFQYPPSPLYCLAKGKITATKISRVLLIVVSHTIAILCFRAFLEVVRWLEKTEEKL
jgi:hypothetical protein